jgi:hypothetical protein
VAHLQEHGGGNRGKKRGRNSVKPQELWETLYAAGFTQAENMPVVVPRAPWYMEAMLFLAIWIGVLTIIGAMVALFFADGNQEGLLFPGAALGGLAFWLFRARKAHFFLIQLAHAASLCGAGLILFALTGMDDWIAFFPRILLVLSILVFCVMDNFVQRLFAACAALFAIAMLCQEFWGHQALWLESLHVVASFAFVLVWQAEMNARRYPHSQLWRSVGYALALFLAIAAVALHFFSSLRWLGLPSEWQESMVLLALRILPGLALFGLVVLLLRREAVALSSRPAVILMFGVSCIALLGAEMPFVSAALLIILTGFAVSAPVLTEIGIFMLLGVFSRYYYWLEASLLRKSVYLMLTGGVLLIVRLALLKSPSIRAREEGEHV